MGFIPDIKRIIGMLPPQRQTLLFSATFSDEIRRLSAQFLFDPTTVEVARRNTPVEAITQYVHFIDANRKRELLAHLVKKNAWDQVLVFCKTKHGANRLATQLQRDGIRADAIHGNKSQNARIRALEDFKAGQVKVLVATDVAARGLDIEELPHVVNYDLPHVPEDYVHRIGRTGRAGATGAALSLVAGEDRPLLAAIEKLINRRIEVRDVEGFGAERGAKAKPAEAPRQEPREKQQRHEPREKQHGKDRGQERPRGRQDSADRRGDKGRSRPAREPRPPADGRLAGNTGGMDFSKPYEPSVTAHAAEREEPHDAKKRTQAVPALFRRKAA